MRTPTPPRSVHSRWGWPLLALGSVVASFCLVLMGYAHTGRVADRHTWDGGPVYLTSTVRGGQHRCTVTPAGGEVRRFSVPAMPNRGPHIAGLRLDPWFTGSAEIVCGDPVRQTHGWVVRLYPLVEQWWLLAGGLLLVLAGLYQRGLFRHISRYP